MRLHHSSEIGEDSADDLIELILLGWVQLGLSVVLDSITIESRVSALTRVCGVTE
jgi:hypothetical protein